MPRTETVLNEGWQFALTNSPMEKPSPRGWRTVSLPHDWAVEAPPRADVPASQGFLERRQVGWYRQELRLHSRGAGRQLFLCCDGASEYVTVYLNVEKLGRHHNGTTPFRYALTDGLTEGVNELLLRVDCTGEPADRWYAGAGLYRTVRILDVPEVWLDPERIVVTQHHRAGQVMLQVETGLAAECSFTLTLPDGRRFETQGCGRGELTVPDPPLWTAETPVLCSLRLALADGSDEVTLRIGLRETRFVPAGFLVNGEQVTLRGVCLHQDVPCVGIAATPENWRPRLLALKGIGVNALHPAHHMFSSEFMDLCDELGFYVLEEAFDKWQSGHYRRYFHKDWLQDLQAMVCRDRNRPSVVLWSVGNEVENQGEPEMLALLAMLAGEVRGMDPTRPVTCCLMPMAASGRSEWQARMEKIRAIAALVDVLSLNDSEALYGEIRRALPEKPLLGSAVHPWFLSGAEDPRNWTDVRPIAFAQRLPWVAGSFIWAGYDYLGESRGWPCKGWTGSLARSDGEPRFSWWVTRALWTREPMIRLGILDNALGDEYTRSQWATPPYLPLWDFPALHQGVLPCAVATNCERVEIRVAGRCLHLPRPGAGLTQGFVPWQSGTIEARGYIGEECVCTHRITTPAQPAELVFDEPRLTLPCVRGWRALIRVHVTDAAENLCLRAAHRVRFEISGPAEILGVDNGCMMSPSAGTAADGTLWLGSISVMIRLNGTPGQVELRALAEGLRSARCQITLLN